MFAVSASQMAAFREDPENFIDGLVVERSLGEVLIHTLDGRDMRFRVFEAPADCDKFCMGDPVAFHPEAEILAVRESWIAARLLTEQGSISVPI